MSFTGRFQISFLFLAILFAAAGIAGPVLADSDYAIRCETESQVRGAKVILKDVAEISGPDDSLKRDLGLVFITRSPMPGHSLKIRRDYMLHRLRLSGLPLGAVDVNIPEMTTVTRLSQSIDPEKIRRFILDDLARREPYKGQDWELDNFRTGRLPSLPLGRLTLSVSLQPASSPTYLTLYVLFHVDDEEAGRVRVSARVKFFGEVVVAVDNLPKGHVLNPGDVKTSRIDLTLIKGEAVESMETAIGQVTKHRLYSGRPVLSRDLQTPVVVEKGDAVTIVAESGALRVTTMGFVQKDGAIGDRVPVINASSNKVVIARILDPNTVRVSF